MNVVTAANPLAVPDGLSYLNNKFSCGGYWPVAFEDPLTPLGGKLTNGGGEEVYQSELFGPGFSDLGMNCLDLETDWLTQSIALPIVKGEPEDLNALTPESAQFSSPLPMSPPSCFPGLPTPESSIPSSPQSSYYSDDPEINDFMCSLLNEEDPHQYSPYESLPLTSPLTPSLPLSSSHGEATNERAFGNSEIIRELLLKPNTEPKLEERMPPAPCAVSKTKEISPRKRKATSSQSPAKRKQSQSVKKERKREQNKTAALRYRQRKRGEKCHVETRREELERENGKLQRELDKMSNEIQYLKKLWLDVCEAKQRKRR